MNRAGGAQISFNPTTDTGLSWQIAPGCLDLLTMLYRIRLHDFSPRDSLTLVVDVESQLWRVSAQRATVENIDGGFRDLPAERIEVDFTPYENLTPRAWKTDLLMNRIGRPGKMLIIWLGPPPQRLPVLMRFGGDDSPVEMKLERVQ